MVLLPVSTGRAGLLPGPASQQRDRGSRANWMSAKPQSSAGRGPTENAAEEAREGDAAAWSPEGLPSQGARPRLARLGGHSWM